MNMSLESGVYDIETFLYTKSGLAQTRSALSGASPDQEADYYVIVVEVWKKKYTLSSLSTSLDTLPHHILIQEIQQSLDLDAETTLIG